MKESNISLYIWEAKMKDQKNIPCNKDKNEVGGLFI